MKSPFGRYRAKLIIPGSVQGCRPQPLPFIVARWSFAIGTCLGGGVFGEQALPCAVDEGSSRGGGAFGHWSTRDDADAFADDQARGKSPGGGGFGSLVSHTRDDDEDSGDEAITRLQRYSGSSGAFRTFGIFTRGEAGDFGDEAMLGFQL